MPASGALSLSLNVPAYRLDVVEEWTPSRSYRVAVGTPDHPTPLGEFLIRRVDWNPWWVPPPFEWAAGERVTPPGPDNPTGRVKLMFGQYMFVHGTPDENSLGRAASHGCVRMANADVIELGRLVHRAGSPGVAFETIDSLVAHPRATRSYELETSVAFTIEYRLAEIRGNRLELHPDIYRRGPLTAAAVRSLLEEAGCDAGRLDRALLEALVERSAREHVEVDVGNLGYAPRAGAPGPDEADCGAAYRSTGSAEATSSRRSGS